MTDRYRPCAGGNIGARYERVEQGAGLRYGIIEVTTRCQLWCPGCYMVRRSALNKGEMSFEQAVHILDLCKEYRGGRELETMDVLGGEPLLWSHLRQFVEELIHRDILPWIFTNMVAITPELARWLFNRRVNVTGKLNIADPKDPVQAALQAEMIGSTETMANKMMGAIEIFLEAGYGGWETQGDSFRLVFKLQNLVRKKNISFVPGYMQYCYLRGIGIDLELMGSGEAVGDEYFRVAPMAEELAEMVRSIVSARGRYSGRLCRVAPQFYDTESKLLMPHVFGSCPFYDKGLYFAVDGHIRACSNSTVVLAHVTDEDPIREAYESPLICRRKALTKDRVGEPCHSCDRWEKCRGGCRATVEGMGDPFGGYTLCPLPILRGSSE